MRSPDFIRDRAKTLRRAMTQPEKLLWSLLRRNQSGLHFRRQHPVGPFIIDFYCAAAPAVVRASLLRIDRTERKEGLAVEIDGPVHADRQEHDDRRTAWLAKEDIQVLRFSTTEIETGPAAVLKAIAQAAPPSTA